MISDDSQTEDKDDSIDEDNLESEDDLFDENDLSDEDELSDEDDPESGDDSLDEDDSENEQLANDDEENQYKPSSLKIRSDIISISRVNKNIENINLGLTLKENFKISIDKYVTSAIVTNRLGISNNKFFGNVSNAKLDVKNINDLSIKIIYTIKVKNIKYYPGYIRKISDIIPDGMVFNESYPENKGWVKSSDSNNIVEYTGIMNEPLGEGEEKYITIAFDLVNKNEGEYYNEVVINDEDLELYKEEVTSEEGDE